MSEREELEMKEPIEKIQIEILKNVQPEDKKDLLLGYYIALTSMHPAY